MFDKPLVLSILKQIDEALGKLQNRTSCLRSSNDFTDTPEGMEKLDGVCMLFIAVGEALKNIDKITDGQLLTQYPEIDWKGAIGFRDIIAHHYFDIDADQVFWICQNELKPLSANVQKMIRGLA
jgi:uncharacterized protein with HEPN domain